MPADVSAQGGTRTRRTAIPQTVLLRADQVIE
jgi:hypothetical protein